MNTVAESWQGYFPLAIMMIVIASWGLYYFLAPARWREWAGAGLVQAFIIALYAEMYGFPLTIYFLTSILPIDIPLAHPSGHLWATLLGYGPIGQSVEMALGFIFIIAGLIFIARGWTRIYYSGGDLRTDGIYSVVRHPQYTGIFLVIFGQLIHWPTIPTIALSPFIIWAYVHLARKEEAEMVGRFGRSYAEYQRRVPMFLPHWSDVQRAIAATDKP
ncbi:isoprenylcysteine carboxylmethyltransferase family protein [Microvirga sp. VF16]|uniref:methyltransferase family protein n=1 Tax=Microvirga sp. VF16 TaxID=2807101 RepID=UPI00193E24C2|nr:isoprenylcysteine carboxylmethyltransferase family protein [Microvirga sp. VF16]QRM34695.1 isoprenylcysteine carboxylmethyltransferase family protein [Microvirga sp. VF16]